MPQQVDGQNREREDDTGRKHQPRRDRHVRCALLQQGPQRRVRWLRAETEEAQRTLDQHTNRQRIGQLHDRRAGHIGQQVDDHDAQRRGASNLSRGDEFARRDAEGNGSHHANEQGQGRGRDDNDDRECTRPDNRRDAGWW